MISISAKKELISLLNEEDYSDLLNVSNELFKNTGAEIDTTKFYRNNLSDMNILRRLALVTTCHKYGFGYRPITPKESENYLKKILEVKFTSEELKEDPRSESTKIKLDLWLNGKGALPDKSKSYIEDLALVYYDTNGQNREEAISIRNSLEENRDQYSLSFSDLENRMLIVNSGLIIDGNARYGVNPVVIPGLTEIYLLDVLKKRGTYRFSYGLETGLPEEKDLEKGERYIFFPNEEENLGLRVIYRNFDRGLIVSSMHNMLIDKVNLGHVTMIGKPF